MTRKQTIEKDTLDKGPEEAKQVEGQIGCQKFAINYLIIACDNLEERLKPVLREKPSGSPGEDARKALVPLARELADHTDQINVQRERLENMLTRMEL